MNSSKSYYVVFDKTTNNTIEVMNYSWHKLIGAYLKQGLASACFEFKAKRDSENHHEVSFSDGENEVIATVSTEIVPDKHSYKRYEYRLLVVATSEEFAEMVETILAVQQ